MTDDQIDLVENIACAVLLVVSAIAFVMLIEMGV